MSDVIAKLRELPDDQLLSTIESVIKKSIDRFKQDVKGRESNIEEMMRKETGKISRGVWKHSQKWSKWTDDGPVLMPDHTRLYYRKGGSEIILQEFPPQTRLLKFNPPLSPVPDAYSLGLPYTIFLFRFEKGLFKDLQCAFSASPLKTLKEIPKKPYLSNINNSLSVCLGTGFQHNKLEKGNLTQQCAFVLDHFWYSTFTKDWDGNFHASQRHFANDSRLSSLENWQAATEEDPLFVLDDVDWLNHGTDSVGDMIAKALWSEPETNKMVQNIVEELTDKVVGETRKMMMSNIESLQQVNQETILKELEKEL